MSGWQKRTGKLSIRSSVPDQTIATGGQLNHDLLTNHRLGSPIQEKKRKTTDQILLSLSPLTQQETSPYLRGTCLHVDRRQARRRVHLRPNNKYNQGLCMHDAGHPVLRPFKVGSWPAEDTVVAQSNSDSVNALPDLQFPPPMHSVSFFGVARQPCSDAMPNIRTHTPCFWPCTKQADVKSITR